MSRDWYHTDSWISGLMDWIATFAGVVLVIGVVVAAALVARHNRAKRARERRIEDIRREMKDIQELSAEIARERADAVLRSNWALRTRILPPGQAEQARARVPAAILDVWLRFGAVDAPDEGISIAPDAVIPVPDQTTGYLDPGDSESDTIAFGRGGPKWGTYVVTSPRSGAVIDVSYDYQGGIVSRHRTFYQWVLSQEAVKRLIEALQA